ncbi:MAG TPA: hypothetical protein EYP68_06330 [Candidatus Korarchaeota archaeon]|nr:hypothetical protein [Candidatus Korarchaeota archaeon]
MKRILFAKLDGKRKRKEVLDPIREFRALAFKRRLGVLVPSFESFPSKEPPERSSQREGTFTYES